MAVLNQAEAEESIPELSRAHVSCSTTFFKWLAWHDGMDASLLDRMKELKEQNRWLMKMYAERRLKAEIIQVNIK